ncbi:MAG: pantoate--beta-alanine ligase [Chitinivibrionales bacterium]|nr:pantoate--beta-alanine ligase [Chitinivibrionales bacterium]
MDIHTDPIEMQTLCRSIRRKGRTIGFVPTMGALHEGHFSLIRQARAVADICAVSIFVNPAQFGPSEDYAKYPRPFEKDCDAAGREGCDLLFAPKSSDMYPENYLTRVAVIDITSRLCGASRPGHFRGVTTIVLKLFNIVQPDYAVFGQKDAQQAIVIQRMIDDLHVPVTIVVAPTVREPGGLAVSSRNAYLTKSERDDVPRIYQALHLVEQAFEKGERSAQSLKSFLESRFAEARFFRPEYCEIVDTTLLKPLDHIKTTALVAVACRTTESGTRLIDNVVLGALKEE